MSQIIVTDSQSTNRSGYNAVEPAIDPQNKPTFLLDWELTLKCNLDCSYCKTGLYGGHWNATSHPPLSECLQTIDFIMKYVDLYMQYKPKWSKAVVLNVYGGESLYHPEIETIFKQLHSRYQDYKNDWPLAVSCTSNLILKKPLLKKVEPYINEWTASYHCESMPKQKQLFKDNAKYLRDKGKSIKVVVLMHSDQSYWPELLEIIEWCKNNNIHCLPRALDGNKNSNYNQEQIEWFNDLYVSKTPTTAKTEQIENLKDTAQTKKPFSAVGRACCGGRKICTNENYKKSVYFIPDNNFTGWSCSVNWFFLYIKQYTKEIFVNKDCKMNFNNEVGPIAYLDNYQDLIDQTKVDLETKNMPVISCKKDKCLCGLCAPKALTKDKFNSIMKKHIKHNVFDNK